MKCKIIAHAVPLYGGPLTVSGPMMAQGQCQTHHVILPGPYFEGQLCPVGQVEKAVEDGLAKIAEALSAARRLAHGQS